MTLSPMFWTYVKVVLLVATVPAIVGFVIVLAERRIMGFMQARLGPNRVGPQGALQGLADLLKLVTKEDITPAKAEKAVHFLAPVLAVIPGADGPRGHPVRAAGQGRARPSIPLWVADINIGLLFLLAHHVDRRLRDHPRRLVLEQQVLAARRAALGGPARLLRGADGPGARLGPPDDAVALARRDRAAPGGHAPLVLLSRAWSPSSSTSWRASRRPTATPSTCPRPSPSSSPASTPSTRA